MADPRPGTPEAFAVAPTEAIDFLRRKTRVPTRMWTDIWQDQHSSAFVVAGAQSDALLADFHAAVNRNIAEGRTLEQFRDDFDAIVARHGWSYHGSRNWRSRVIFETNLRMAYSAGRWQQIQRLKKARPYLRYVHVDPELHDPDSRELHASWHDTVLLVDDPWWETHCPPNGWGCRCSVQSLSVRDLKRYGLKVSPAAPKIDMQMHTLNTRHGPVTISVPAGIDPGFAYNPGGAGILGRGVQQVAIARQGDARWPELVAPGYTDAPPLPPLPLERPIAAPIRGDTTAEPALRAALRHALGADEAVLVDPIAGRLHVGQAIVDHWLERPGERLDGREQYLPFIRELVEDPAEIWIGWAIDPRTGRVALRRRYVKLIDLGDGRTVGLIADSEGGQWVAMTFFPGAPRRAARNLRRGLMVYSRV